MRNLYFNNTKIYNQMTENPLWLPKAPLPTNDDLLGCKLEAVRDVVILELSFRILQNLHPNPTPNSSSPDSKRPRKMQRNTVISSGLLGACRQTVSKYSKINKGHQKIAMIIIITEDYSDLDDYAHI